MAQETKEESLLQARVDQDLFDRLMRQRERWGMTNKEIITRILERALPDWEQTDGPPGGDPK